MRYVGGVGLATTARLPDWVVFRDRIGNMLEAREQELNEAKTIYADYCRKDLTKFDEWREEFEESWQGKWDSMVDFTIELVDSSGLIDDIPNNWKPYFDYEKFSRDLLMDGYWEVNRHIFRDI